MASFFASICGRPFHRERTASPQPDSAASAAPGLTLNLLRCSVGLLSLSMFGCALTMPAATSPAPLVRATPAALQVGVARADITPHPGYSMFGHGPDSRVASGYWSRLECRAFYFETNAPGFAVVSCDLQAISTLLQRRVAALTEPIVPASRLMLTATHTHAAPAHYWDATLYNDLTSTRFPGYDEDLVSSLAERIAGAVERAYRTKQPARVRWVQQEVWGLSRNRSLRPFDANEPRFHPTLPPGLTLPNEQCAIDPVLRVLQIDQANTAGDLRRPIGSISFFAMHPSVLPATNHLFGGDTHGVAARVVERDLRRTWRTASPALRGCVDPPNDRAHANSQKCPDPVHALINTNEGDMIPVYATKSADEAIRVGEQLGSTIVAAGDDENAPALGRRATTPWKDTIILDLRYLEVELPSAGFRGSPIQLCSDAQIGVGVTLGGSDHPSSLVPLRQTEVNAADFDASHCQAPKSAFIRGGSYGLPKHVPLALGRIDGTWISFIPAEMTVTAGARLGEVVRRIASEDDPQADAVVAGLSNGYIEYIATREEYQLQHYEGASTLYGPWTAEFLTAKLATLALSMRGIDVSPYLDARGPRIGEAAAFDYMVGPSREKLEREEPLWHIEGARRPMGLCRVRKPRRPRVCFWWIDAAPNAVPLGDAPWIEIARDRNTPAHRLPAGGCDPHSIEPCAANIDDRGIAFMTRARNEDSGGLWLWSTVFTPSVDDWRRIQELGSVRIRARGSAELPPTSNADPRPAPSAHPAPASKRLHAVESDAFSADTPPRECSSEEAVRCGF